MDHCSKAYIRVTHTEHGAEVKPADIKAFATSQGVGQRLEPKLTPMPQEVSWTSIAISLARIADSLEVIEQAAVATYGKKYKSKKWWHLKREKKDEPSN